MDKNIESTKILSLYSLHKKMTDTLSSAPIVSGPSDFTKIYNWLNNLVNISKKIDEKNK